ncbi:MAG: polysaccharide pyruvyl transferase family protein, partial [Synergistaceae bacterium]|nr:polysaccharide pyruvyl transferase family protein [Synergistaceae bacterium]
MKTYKIALLGYYGFGNLGDELLLRSSIEILENVNIKREKIVVLSNNPAETSEVFKVKSVNRWKFSEVRTALKQSEFLVLGGGGLF